MIISWKESAITIHWDNKRDGETETSELKGPHKCNTSQRPDTSLCSVGTDSVLVVCRLHTPG